MSVKTHGKVSEPIERDYHAEIYKLVGDHFPLTLVVTSGKLLQASYDSEWQEGTTEPVEDDEGKVIEYKPNYKKRQLTKDQTKKLDKYLSDNISTE